MGEYLGEAAALACSLFWAICSLAFAAAGRRAGASSVNFVRIQIAVVALTGIHFAILGCAFPEGVSVRQATLLAVSGVLGLAIADLLLFRCMTVLGARTGSLLMGTSPVLTMFLESILEQRWPTGQAILGVFFVVFGVGMVIRDRSGRAAESSNASASEERRAIWFGVIAALGQSVGILMTDAGLEAEGSETQVAPISGTWIRMLAASVGMLVGAILLRRTKLVFRVYHHSAALRLTALGAIFGPILGVWMLSEAVVRTEAWVVSTLSSLAPIFLIPILWFGFRTRPSWTSLLGTVVAIGGAVLVMLRESGAP